MKIAACLLLQACLLLFRLDLLPVWGDEQFTLDICTGEFGKIVPAVAADNHPPAYYALVWLWLRAIPGPDVLVNARLLSALVMLLATWVLWRWFLRRLQDRTAAHGVLLLWVLSPFALMYGRMARSYSLQLLLFLIAVRTAEEALATRRFTAAGLITALLLYVHYVPGFCLLTVLGFRLLIDRRWRQAAGFASIVMLAYTPWIFTALSTASRELAKNVHLVFQGHLAEHPLRLAYTWIAWHLGETLPLPLIMAALPLTVFWALLGWHGARAHRRHALALGSAAVIGYAFVSRVVIFALVPARILFLTPFYMMLAATGRARFPRAATAGVAAMAMLDVIAIGNYFGKVHYLNKGYLIPFDEIAARFQASGHAVVLVDVTSVDTRPVWPRIPPELRRGRVDGPLSLEAVDVRDPVVFHVRGPRDLSWGHWNDWVDRELAKTRTCVTEGFTPYDRYDHWLMERLGWPEKPSHLLQLVTCRR